MVMKYATPLPPINALHYTIQILAWTQVGESTVDCRLYQELQTPYTHTTIITQDVSCAIITLYVYVYLLSSVFQQQHGVQELSCRLTQDRRFQ